MLRDLGSSNRRAQGTPDLGAPLAGGMLAGAARRCRPRLLIVHHGDLRLAALEAVLGDLGYGATVAAGPDEALAAIARDPVPDVLLTAPTPGGPRRGIAFARDCLARVPGLRALYISFVPRPAPELSGARESVLAAPFNADQFAAALAALWPADDERP
jgi:CheY-like chemotaxis protein